MRCRAGVPFVLVVLLSGPVCALTDEEIFRDFRFNLINPGARSLALGGAFVSVADDATAAQANPAGLSFLRRYEYFAEVRAVDNGAQSSIVEEQLPLDLQSRVAVGTDLEDVVSPSFISGVWTRARTTLALSRQELLNIENSTLASFRLSVPDTPGALLVEGVGSIDVLVTNINLSGGIRLTDHLGLGATVTVSRLDVHSEVTNTVVDTNRIVAETPLLEPTVDLRTSINESDRDLIFSFGILYKRPNKWGVGAVYRKGPSFRVTEQIDAIGSVDGMPTGIDLFGVRDRLGFQFDNRFHLPDIAGVGGNWLPMEQLTLSLDVEHIRYSNLLDDFVAGVNVLTQEDAEFKIDDAVDYRFGIEYLLLNVKPLTALALRAGAFTESDSTIRAISTGTSESFATEEAFRGRDTQLHGAVGVGINFKRFKIDLAMDWARTDNEYLISAIYQGK